MDNTNRKSNADLFSEWFNDTQKRDAASELLADFDNAAKEIAEQKAGPTPTRDRFAEWAAQLFENVPLSFENVLLSDDVNEDPDTGSTTAAGLEDEQTAQEPTAENPSELPQDA